MKKLKYLLILTFITQSIFSVVDRQKSSIDQTDAGQEVQKPEEEIKNGPSTGKASEKQPQTTPKKTFSKPFLICGIAAAITAIALAVFFVRPGKTRPSRQTPQNADTIKPVLENLEPTARPIPPAPLTARTGVISATNTKGSPDDKKTPDPIVDQIGNLIREETSRRNHMENIRTNYLKALDFIKRKDKIEAKGLVSALIIEIGRLDKHEPGNLTDRKLNIVILELLSLENKNLLDENKRRTCKCLINE